MQTSAALARVKTGREEAVQEAIENSSEAKPPENGPKKKDKTLKVAVSAWGAKSSENGNQPY